jgi:hypothetical protein
MVWENSEALGDRPLPQMQEKARVSSSQVLSEVVELVEPGSWRQRRGQEARWDEHHDAESSLAFWVLNGRGKKECELLTSSDWVNSGRIDVVLCLSKGKQGNSCYRECLEGQHFVVVGGVKEANGLLTG